MAGVRRESKGRFWQRMEQEGHLAGAQAVEDELLSQGLTRRQVQERLVARFQPADGTKTRSWDTPDSWQRGRKCFRRPKPSPAERYDDDLHWAYTHLGRVKPDDAPDPQKRLLLLFAEEKPAEFARKYNRALPGITRRQEKREGDRRQRAAEGRLRRAKEEWDRLRPQREKEEKKKWERERKRLWRARKQQEQEAEDRRQQEEKARQEQERQRQQQEKERQEKYLRERREATLAVLHERRTKEGTGQCGSPAKDTVMGIEVQAHYWPLMPAWPNGADPDVTGSTEAKVWVAVLERANAGRRADAERKARETLAERQAKRMKDIVCKWCHAKGGGHKATCSEFVNGGLGRIPISCFSCGRPVPPTDPLYMEVVKATTPCPRCREMARGIQPYKTEAELSAEVHENELRTQEFNRKEAAMHGESIRNMQAAAERHWIRTGERG